MIRTMYRHLVDSLKDLKRNGWMSIAAITAVTITLLLLASFMTFMLNVNQFAKDVQKNVAVSVFVNTNTNKEELHDLENNLKKMDNVDKVKFSSKEQEYHKLVKQMGKSWDVFTEKDNPLYNVFIVYAKDPRYTDKIQNQAKKMPHVANATYGGADAAKILKVSDKIKKWGIIASVILLIISILLISNTIKLTIISRADDIKIMRLVGAKNSYIRWPFFLEGAWIGLLGSVIPLLLLRFGYSFIYNQMQLTLAQTNYQLMTTTTVMNTVGWLVVGTGIIIGSFGSIISMQRFLKV